MYRQHEQLTKLVIPGPGMIELVLHARRASRRSGFRSGIPIKASQIAVDNYHIVLSSTASRANPSSSSTSFSERVDNWTLNSVISKPLDKRIVLVEEERDHAIHTRTKSDQEKESSDSVASRITVYGLLNALEGIRDREGCILFAMTNNYRCAALVHHRAFSNATLIGYLMTYETHPHDAVDDVEASAEARKQEDCSGLDFGFHLRACSLRSASTFS
ncbi:hypothetical protein OH76DRAFT_1483327 [Lentinus brumalis]|uniref:Uncharacterized protein n=1 Tax=Lentinus brumalis TaxID=2498619 RepID=A0A371D995_9APHY|nr:hypothetical protein OH76DRAFT_1483327 [Polyporus brumalis]